MNVPHGTISIEELIAYVAGHPTASLYRDHWGGKRRFDDLPFLAVDSLVTVPLSSRRYKDVSSLVKIVRSDRGPFLSEWSFEDIGREPWGLPPQRPLVYMTDSHEAIEKSMWCYENGILPVIGEADPDIAAYTATAYNINQLITDAPAALQLRPYLDRRTEPLEALTFIGGTFDAAALAPFAGYARATRLVLALPEVGAIATAYPGDATFKAVPNCLVEQHSGEYVVTKRTVLVTPVIRYRTGIRTADVRIDL